MRIDLEKCHSLFHASKVSRSALGLVNKLVVAGFQSHSALLSELPAVLRDIFMLPHY